MGLILVQGDIALATTQAIVNAANSALQEGTGVCGAIFGAVNRVGGHSKLTSACRAIGHCDEGSAAITSSFGLPSEFIIHAVGPRWNPPHVVPSKLDASQLKSVQTLANTYRSILKVCEENGISSVSIPAISTGVFGVPKQVGAAIAMRICTEAPTALDVQLVAFSAGELQFYKEAPTSEVEALMTGITL
jgi:O-acetyl-ADP-ribose deacetylase